MRSRSWEEAFAERTKRLERLFQIRAPREMLVMEARLMAEAADGGPARHILVEIRRLIGYWWMFHVVDPFSRLLCRLNIRHDGERDEDGYGCVWCQRGATVDLPECDCEEGGSCPPS